MSTVDYRMSECLRTNIDAFQNNDSVKVEDLISRVKLENSQSLHTNEDFPIFMNNKKRQSLVFENTIRTMANISNFSKQQFPQNTLERAFEEF